jgi:tRNA-specific 2-thiouridylase
VTREADGTARLRRARDAKKDQSYALYMLGQEQLRRLLLPIGELADKSETRRIAARHRLPTANKPDSQDICFIGGDYREFARERVPDAFIPGPIHSSDGAVLGTHSGIGGFTVGQREGLGIATGERLYVLRIDPAAQAIVVGRRDELGRTRYRLRDVRFTRPIAGTTIEADVALRYRGSLTPATLDVDANGADLVLREPAAVAPGQAAVLYRGDEVIGGGVIAAS